MHIISRQNKNQPGGHASITIRNYFVARLCAGRNGTIQEALTVPSNDLFTRKQFL